MINSLVFPGQKKQMIPRVRSRMTTTNRIVKVIEHLLSLRAKRRSVNTLVINCETI